MKRVPTFIEWEWESGTLYRAAVVEYVDDGEEPEYGEWVGEALITDPTCPAYGILERAYQDDWHSNVGWWENTTICRVKRSGRE